MESRAREMKIFVKGLMQGSPDLSVLTQRSIREQFLKHVGCNSIEKEAKQTLKKIVEKELLKMQVDDPSDSKSSMLKTVGEKTKKRARSSSCSSSEDGAKKNANSAKKKKPVPKKKHLDLNAGEHSDRENTKSTSEETALNLPAANTSDNEKAAERSVKSSGPVREANIQNGTMSQKGGDPNRGTFKGKLEKRSKVLEIPRKARPLKVRPSESSSDEEQSEESRKLKKPRKRPLKKRLTKSSSEEEEEPKTIADFRIDKPPKPRLSKGGPKEEPKKSAKLKERSPKATLAEINKEDQELKKATSVREMSPKARKPNHCNDSSEEEQEEESKGSKEAAKQRNIMSQRGRHPEARKGGEEESLSSSEEEEPKKCNSLRGEPLKAKKTMSSDIDEKEMLQMHGSSRESAPKAQETIRGSESSEEEKCENNATPRGILHKARSTTSSEEEDEKLELVKMPRGKQSKAITRDSSEEEEEEPKAKKVRKDSSGKEMPKEKDNELTEHNLSAESRVSDSVQNIDKAIIKESSSSGSADEEYQAGRKTKGDAPAKTHTESSMDDSSEEEARKEKAPVLSKGKSGAVQKSKGTSKVPSGADKASGSNSSSDSDSSNGTRMAKDSSQPKKDHHDGGSETCSSSTDDHMDDGTKQGIHTKEQKVKKQRKKTSEREQPTGDDHPSIKRLKRYINACGVRKNYKKLFEGHRSVKSKVAVLKQELEDLGVKGNPTLEKCKVVKLMREEREELASLDLSNIISNSGRPRRRSAWEPNQTPSKSPPQEHKRYVGSDSEDDQPPRKRRVMDWGNLQGIISDDSSG